MGALCRRSLPKFWRASSENAEQVLVLRVERGMSVQLLLRRRALTKTLSPLGLRSTSACRSASSQVATQHHSQPAHPEAGPSTLQIPDTKDPTKVFGDLVKSILSPSDTHSKLNGANGSGTSLVPRSDAQDPTRVQAYLSSIHATGPEPTIADLERCRPRRYASPDSRHYAKEYAALKDTLCRSFTNRQLRNFLLEYGAKGPRTRSKLKKASYADAIMQDQWNWPSPEEVEKARQDRTKMDFKGTSCTSYVVVV